jgi:hypothetical protein
MEPDSLPGIGLVTFRSEVVSRAGSGTLAILRFGEAPGQNKVSVTEMPRLNLPICCVSILRQDTLLDRTNLRFPRFVKGHHSLRPWRERMLRFAGEHANHFPKTNQRLQLT